MTYEEILIKAPPHDTPEFLQYLRDHNKVVGESPDWLVIENCKYHTNDKPWHTAFAKLQYPYFHYLNLHYLDWAWVKKPGIAKRLHIHLTPEL